MNSNGTTLSDDLTRHHMRLTSLVTPVSSPDSNDRELSQNDSAMNISSNLLAALDTITFASKSKPIPISNLKSQKTLLFFQFLKKCLGVESEARVWAREEQNDTVRFFAITSMGSRSLQFVVWLVGVE